MAHSVSFLASVVAGVTLSTVAMPSLSLATEDNPALATPNLEEQAVATQPLSVDFPDVQSKVEASLQQQQVQGVAKINAQLDKEQTLETTDSAVDKSLNAVATNVKLEQGVNPQALSQAQDNLQPVAMVKMADGKIYPVYVAQGQNFDGNLAHAPENAVAYLAVPAQELSKQGIVMPLATTQENLAANANTSTPNTGVSVKRITNTPQSNTQQTLPQSVDPAYSPQVKVYGTNTPTFIGSRAEASNYINNLRDSGAYSYNVNAPSSGTDYGYYYQYGSGYYAPYYGGGHYGYFQDRNGQWHVINGFRYDPSINNYVPVIQDYGSCVGADCPVVVLPKPQPYPPQGPATGQPPAWGPPPSYRPDPVDPGFSKPGYQPRPPRPAYPHPTPTRPTHPSQVDPGFTHPFG